MQDGGGSYQQKNLGRRLEARAEAELAECCGGPRLPVSESYMEGIEEVFVL